jgi:regulatory protein YycI of two-component signal transduction system YycFG
LIRSALKNNNLVSFDQLIENNRYLKQTRDALCLFFSGNTKYKGQNKSWYKQFKSMKADECCKFLCKM